MENIISLIVTTYNREDALEAVLGALEAQTDRNFEIVIADDGSRPATAALVNRWTPKFGNRLKHCWHPDDGFRAAEIRNRGILASVGDYCVFLDGDCLPRPQFVARHRALAEPNCFVSGNRVLLSKELTEQVLKMNSHPERWRLSQWLAHRIGGGINRIAPLVTLPLGPLRKLRRGAWRGVRSCNFAIWRADLDRVDGFDVAFQGWGREDSDLVIRLLRAGVHRKDGEFSTAVLHLWHPMADQARLPENDKMLQGILKARTIRAQSGLQDIRRSQDSGISATFSERAPMRSAGV